MKYLIPYLFTFFLFLTGYSQGWRQDEMQIRVKLTDTEQIEQLKAMNISFEPVGSTEVRAYVVPKELFRLQSLNFQYVIEVEDLNKNFEGYWNTKDAYHSYEQIIALADSLENAFPGICKKYVYGVDASGLYQLAALKISDNVLTDEPEPEVMFDGGIHGDEIGGSENLIRFARDLCLDYGTNATITGLIDEREIWLYLMVNPWGRVNMSRYNVNGVDLNRDWAYMWDAWGGSSGPCSQVESKALRECMYNNQFVIHTTYHSGTEYISYPWSYRPDSPPDVAHINQLAALYSTVSGYSNFPYGSGYNGMYAINGSTKDSNYGIMGSISWSIEISNNKQPPPAQIMTYYNYNYPSMVMLIEYSGYGLGGMVTDATTGDPVPAIIFVNNFFPTYNDPVVGDFHKYVLPGTYTVTVMANGYQTQTLNNIVVATGNATITNFQLQPGEGWFAYRFAASQIPENNYSDEGWTPGSLGAPDNVNYSIGKNGWCVLDMQSPVFDGPGMDLIVYEGDATPEGYTCFAGTSVDGPWAYLGIGNGTTEFDLATGQLVEARFIKIVDDGDGTANAANAGFDLDAVGAMDNTSGVVYLSLSGYVIDDSQGNSNGQIDPGETVDLVVSIRNNGELPAENTTGTLNSSSPYITLISNTADFGILGQGQVAEGIYTLTADAGTPEGETVMFSLAVSANNGSYNSTFVIGLMIGHIVEDWETGTMTKFDWQTGGNGNWNISTQTPYEGSYCVKSGSIGNDQSTYLQISYNVLASGEIGFFKKVSSEASYDFLRFYIDGNLMDQWSGQVAWSEESFSVTSGFHTFKWVYIKDASVIGGSDCAWLDYITLPAGALNSVFAGFVADVTQVCEGETVNFTDISTGNVISWDWLFEGGSPSSSSSQNPTVAYLNAGSFDVSLTVSDGSESNTFTVQDYIHVLADPVSPGIPSGAATVNPQPGQTNEYTIDPVPGAQAYFWQLEPAEAGAVIENGNSCLVDWTDYWQGMVELSAKCSNDCGESSWSEPFQITAVTTSIKDSRLSGFTLWPNPVKEKLFVHLDDSDYSHTEVTILTNLGIVIFSKSIQELTNQPVEIDLSQVDAGIYYLVIRSQGNEQVQKLIIQ